MRFAPLLLVLILPMQAAALSCSRPSVARTYTQADSAPQTYVIVKGRLTFDTGKMPRTGSGRNNPPKMTHVAAQLVGKFMSPSGFNVPFDHPITLEVTCLGPWCGGAENGHQVLAFVRREQGEYALAITPCGGHVFANPKPAMLKKVMQCSSGHECRAD